MFTIMLAIKLFLILCAFQNICMGLTPPCNNNVYCHGPLLHVVQLSHIFNDSKTFVDMKMKENYETTLRNFDEFMVATNSAPSKAQVRMFVENNFEEGDELEKWQPGDYHENPKFLQKISDLQLRDFARQLVEIWPTLARKVKPEVFRNVDRYSFIPVPHGFIIPGGRFKELYYWDSYWIISGLLISEMNETARGMIENFLHVIHIYGFIPNGGRIYYLNRSQPPLLTKMVALYYKYTKNRAWLRQNIKYLTDELHYWLKKKTLQVQKGGKAYTIAHYHAEGTGPRPESYALDVRAAGIYPNDEDKDQLYVNIKSGAESGWDFSSRWIFDNNGGNVANLSHIETRRVIPVDLNSYLCEAFNSLSFLYSELGDQQNTEYWQKMGTYWQKSIEAVLWNNEDGIWYDLDLKLSEPRKYFYPSNVAPLWTGCFDNNKKQVLGKSVLKYLKTVGALETPGGIPASLAHTGEQWDFPNAWAPLQALVAQGLHRSDVPEAITAAKDIADKWIKANIRGFRDTGEMYEKYDAMKPGIHGEGGEYFVQAGFGWTNGVALQFIYDYFCNNSGERRSF